MWDSSFLTRDRTHSPCSGRWSLNHWTTREVPSVEVLSCVYMCAELWMEKSFNKRWSGICYTVYDESSTMFQFSPVVDEILSFISVPLPPFNLKDFPVWMTNCIAVSSIIKYSYTFIPVKGLSMFNWYPNAYLFIFWGIFHLEGNQCDDLFKHLSKALHPALEGGDEATEEDGSLWATYNYKSI